MSVSDISYMIVSYWNKDNLKPELSLKMEVNFESSKELSETWGNDFNFFNF